MYVRNAWYVGAWDHEVTRGMRRRILLDEPILFFRCEDGTPVALEDRCCHRQAPLSMGKLIGDIVKCPYHGLEFDQTGACVKVPSQDRVPASARVKSFPVIEKNQWMWIWMGDPAKADPALIEDFHWLDDPGWGAAGSSFISQRVTLTRSPSRETSNSERANASVPREVGCRKGRCVVSSRFSTTSR